MNKFILMLAAFLVTDASAFVVGINTGSFAGNFDSAGKVFTKELGVQSIRVAFNHGDHDADVAWAAANDKGVVFFLGYGVGCDPKTELGRQCYANRSAGLAQKYGSKVEYYEIWNEWNGGMGLDCGHLEWPCNDGAVYADLLCRTYKAVKAARPSAKIVGGATASVDIDFIRKMLDAGAGNCMDKISVHPYVYNEGPFTIPYNSSASAGIDKFIEGMTAVDNLVRQKTGRSIPILITETGRNDRQNASNEGVTAAFLEGIYNRARATSFIEGIFWYELEDQPGNQPGWGLVRSNNTKKPAFAAFKAAASGGAPVEPPPILEVSPSGAVIPPLTYIVDAKLGVWRVDAGRIYLNGSPLPSSSVDLLLWHFGVIYQRNSFGGWWKWVSGEWMGTSDPRVPAPPPPIPVSKLNCGAGMSVVRSGTGTMAECE